jgi:hypothetical protein
MLGNVSEYTLKKFTRVLIILLFQYENLFVKRYFVAVPGSENSSYQQLTIAGLLTNGKERIGWELGAYRLYISRQTWSAYFWDRLLWISKDLMIDRMIDSGKLSWKQLWSSSCFACRGNWCWTCRPPSDVFGFGGQEGQELWAKILSLLRRYDGHIGAKVFKHSLTPQPQIRSCHFQDKLVLYDDSNRLSFFSSEIIARKCDTWFHCRIVPFPVQLKLWLVRLLDSLMLKSLKLLFRSRICSLVVLFCDASDRLLGTKYRLRFTPYADSRMVKAFGCVATDLI